LTCGLTAVGRRIVGRGGHTSLMFPTPVDKSFKEFHQQLQVNKDQQGHAAADGIPAPERT
jgi:hypothetical protein